MNKAKKYALWVLGGLVAILAVILGISYERQKIQKLKQKSLEGQRLRLEKEAAAAKALRDVALQREEKLANEETKIDKRIEAIDEEIAAVQDEVEEMSTDEMVDEFNSLYGSSGK
jgi:uncharacterized protein HemX